MSKVLVSYLALSQVFTDMQNVLHLNVDFFKKIIIIQITFISPRIFFTLFDYETNKANTMNI